MAFSCPIRAVRQLDLSPLSGVVAALFGDRPTGFQSIDTLPADASFSVHRLGELQVRYVLRLRRCPDICLPGHIPSGHLPRENYHRRHLPLAPPLTVGASISLQTWSGLVPPLPFTLSPRDKSGPALGDTEYRLMPSACRLIVRQPL